MDILYFKSADSLFFPISCGVYSIHFINSPIKKYYIGSASKHLSSGLNKGFNFRWKCHLLKLRKNKHHSSKLQNAFNKYGEENLIFEIIELCDPEKCLEKEQFYIDQFDSYYKGYNCRPKASTQLGLRHKKSTKNKISKFYRQKRDLLSEEILLLYNSGKTSREIGNMLNIHYKTVLKILKENNIINLRNRADYIKIKIFQYSLNGELINKWDSILECSKQLNWCESNIRNVLINKQKQTKGFFFSFKEMDNLECILEMEKLKLERDKSSQQSYKDSFTPERLKGCSERAKGNSFRGRIKNIKQFDMDGNLIKIWEDSKAIVLFYNLKNITPILRVLRGKRKKFKNYYWSL